MITEMYNTDPGIKAIACFPIEIPWFNHKTLFSQKKNPTRQIACFLPLLYFGSFMQNNIGGGVIIWGKCEIAKKAQTIDSYFPLF